VADDLHAVASHDHAAPHVLQVPLALNQVDRLHRVHPVAVHDRVHPVAVHDRVHPVAVHDRVRLAQDRAVVEQTRLKLLPRQQQPRHFQHKAI